MSGHYATLLRGTVERMMPNQDVYITDWFDARDIPTSAGKFDLDDYVDYIIEFLEYIGEGKVVRFKSCSSQTCEYPIKAISGNKKKRPRS